MAELAVDGLSILRYTTSYNVTRKNISTEYQMENGNIKSYVTAIGFYQIDVGVVCNGEFFSQIEEIIFKKGEKNVKFTYGNSLRSANMIVTNIKATCIALHSNELWKLTFSLRECRR